MRILLLLMFFLSTVAAASAEHSAEHADDSELSKVEASDVAEGIAVAKNEIVVQVSGTVCSFCAYGLQKKLGKLSFVDNAKYNKGVKIDIDNQLAVIALLPGKKYDLDAIKKTVVAGGYEPKKIYIGDAVGNIQVIEVGGDDE